MAENYKVNYEDQRFDQVEADKDAALTQLDETYSGIIGQTDKFYQDQIDASQQWADTQSQLQQEQTDFTIEQVEQQKDQAHKDYLKEQSGAYVDFQKQSNQYGAEAEKAASAGLAGTGFSESSQVSMYNTYQNRVATARESYTRAILNYDNAIKDARLQNNSVLAEIAYQALQQQLQLSLEGFQYKNSLILEQANKKVEMDNMYYNRYLDVLEQINTENALAENVRQFNENKALEQQKLTESIRQFNKNYEMQVKEYNEQIRQFEVEIERLKKKDAQEYELQIKELQLKQDQAKEAKRQFEEEQKLKREQLAEQKRQFDEQMAASSSSGSGGSGKITNSSGSSGGGSGKIDSSYEVNTPYYQGKKNPDVSKYGAFSNGYQPKGISGHGKLSNSKMTMQLSTQTRAGQKQTLVQTVWKAEDGTLWYWEGRKNAYIQITSGGSGGGGGSGSKPILKLVR